MQKNNDVNTEQRGKTVIVVDFGSKKVPDIARCLQACGCNVRVENWEHVNEQLANEYDALILSGAPVMLTEKQALYVPRFEFLKTYARPILAICFGHQLLGLVHGAEVFRHIPVRTNVTIESLCPSPLTRGFGTTFIMRQDHTEGISLPPNFRHVAQSTLYKIEMMEHASKAMYGVQFHPEVSEENGMTLFRNFCQLL